MKILVIEDTQRHRESAEETLAGHDLTIVSSFDEAMELMKEGVNWKKVRRLITESGLSRDDEGYNEVSKEAEQKATASFDFDVVLTDMMMPMSRQTLAQEAFRNDELVPYGFVIALKAAKCGAKFVAVVTDTNHHQGAISASLDNLCNPYYQEGQRPNLVVNDATVMFAHAPFTKEGETCERCDSTGKRGDKPCARCEGTGEDKKQTDKKDWGQVLKDLTQ